MLELAFVFLSGLLVSLTDCFSDKKNKLGYITGLGFGIIIAILISQGGPAATILAGGVLGVLLAGKIDSKLHLTGGLAGAITLGILNLPELNWRLAVIFGLAGFTDEFLDEKLTRKKLLITRPLLPLAALITSYLTGEWLYFLTIALFDTGYFLGHKFDSLKPYKRRKKINKKLIPNQPRI